MDQCFQRSLELPDGMGIDETFRSQHRHAVHLVDLDEKVSHAYAPRTSLNPIAPMKELPAAGFAELAPLG
jgi:hypothetical protein